VTRPRYIVVEGPTGVGKTAFARRLGERLGSRVVEAPGNPLASRFYEDPRRYAFSAQLYFVLSRYPQREEVHQEDLFSMGVVSDYLLGCGRIYAQLTLGRDELTLYDKVSDLLGAQLAPPDLVVYLQARPEVLWQRLRRRVADTGERIASREFVEKASKGYAEFFFNYGESPLLIVNTSDIDFVERRQDEDELVAVIQKHKAGVAHYSPLGSK
jgi:deoxyadenosine/deoxycytidine kinase